jgi:hypothetical protein
MLRLDLSNAARWLDLSGGVKLKVEPLTTSIIANARRDPAVAAAVKLLGDGDLVGVAMAKAVARRVIADWQGVGDADGKAVKPTPAGIDALMDVWPMFDAFQNKYLAAGFQLDSEKNGSAPSLNGTTAAARNTAVPAKKPARTARKP